MQITLKIQKHLKKLTFYFYHKNGMSSSLAPSQGTPGAKVNQDKTCLLFSGTVVVAGRCKAVVISTGTGTVIYLLFIYFSSSNFSEFM